MKNTPIHVTQDHIDQGLKKSQRRCPIALAMIDWYREGGIKRDDIRVLSDCIEIADAPIFMEKKVKDWISDFDSFAGQGIPPQPFSFEIQPHIQFATFLSYGSKPNGNIDGYCNPSI